MYDSDGDITEKFGKELVNVLILPNAKVLESSSEHST